MEGSLRQIGIGDLVVSKHVGRMMGALGGRLGAFRDAAGQDLTDAVRRNVFHEAPPSDEALHFVSRTLDHFRSQLDAADPARIRAGSLPAL
jgi:cytochrome b pre-mRNA-processing protein 3